MVGRKGDSYVGGHTIFRMHPVGVEERPKKISKGKSSALDDYYNEMPTKLIAIAKEKAAIRRYFVTGEDEVLLGMKSSGWETFRPQAVRRFQDVRNAGIVGADKIAHALNRFGFKTGSGANWTPRLVMIFLDKVLGQKKRIQRTGRAAHKRISGVSLRK